MSKSNDEMMRETLQGIADANWREWDESLATPEQFVAWAKSRASHTLAALSTPPESAIAEPVGEVTGHHRVGAGEMPTIMWRDGYWPTIGTKLYPPPIQPQGAASGEGYVLEEIERISLVDFARRHDLTIKVSERTQRDLGSRWTEDSRYYARLEGAEVKSGGCLSSEYGNGATPEAAISAYAERISNKHLVIDAYKDTRKEITTPYLRHAAPPPQEPVADAWIEPTGAIEALTKYQRQIDEDGTEVGVSRQALDEVLTYLSYRIKPELPDESATVELGDRFDGGISMLQSEVERLTAELEYAKAQLVIMQNHAALVRKELTGDMNSDGDLIDIAEKVIDEGVKNRATIATLEQQAAEMRNAVLGAGREAFEKWAADNWTYANGKEDAWECWQAALKLSAPPTQGDVPKLTPHLYREMVNELRDAAITYARTQQLRERICRVVEKYLSPVAQGEVERDADCLPEMPNSKPLLALGKRLTELLDDDKWNEIEPMLFAVGAQIDGAAEKAVILDLMDYIDTPPERNCSCHLSPPCNDCVNFSHLRDLLEQAHALLQPAQQNAEKE